MRFYFYLFVTLSALTSGCSSVGQIDQKPKIKQLHAGWEFKASDSLNWRSASVPGVVHTDLLDHKLIPDPWYGMNEKEIQWVEEKNWEYQVTFDLTAEELEHSSVTLNFDGLDTYASITLNDKQLGLTDNMFRSWKYQVKDFLQVGKNRLHITFESPVNKWSNHVQSAPIELPASSEMVDVRVSPYVRKAPYHFGWDWGPRYVTSGVWRPVYLKFSNDAVINDVQVYQTALTDSLAEITISASITSQRAAHYTVLFGAKQLQLSNFKGDTTLQTTVEIPQPKRWWPNGWGEQHMYDVIVKIKQDNLLIDQKERKIGLRTIELVQEPDELGRSFYFKVNGHKLFARGANYIPQSNFLTDVKHAQYDSIILDAKAVNMNMIRVWGGGIYEDDYFYELCDQHGILVWQDFMFAGTMYPGDDDFLESVSKEVTENVLRLRNHPSIAHWNGNNEIEVAWHQWGWQRKYKYSKSDSTLLYNNYLKLFDTLIPSIVNKLDPDRSYTPTSPERSYTKLKETKSGTVHYWGVWHAGHKFEKYRQYLGRFMAEWGFQSFPDMETIKTFSSEKDWALDSDVMKWKQKSPPGNGLIEKQGLQYFSKPETFADFVAFSQRTQALAMRVAIDAHRLAEYNGGTLYWQLNDCWPGPSWSTRDVYGRWKEAHKQLKWLYAPIAVIPRIENGAFELVMINDGIQSCSSKLRLTTLDGDTAAVIHEENVQCNALDRIIVFQNKDKKWHKSLKNGSFTIRVELIDEQENTFFERVIDAFDVVTY